eukprot:scaffold158_cov126-Isochrysis_galbana.AAC.1
MAPVKWAGQYCGGTTDAVLDRPTTASDSDRVPRGSRLAPIVAPIVDSGGPRVHIHIHHTLYIIYTFMREEEEEQQHDFRVL